MHGTGFDAKSYLEVALDLMQQHALTRASLDWHAIRSGARSRCAHGRNPEGAYDAIRWALESLGDGHSFFSAPEVSTRAIAEGGHIGEASVPSARLLSSGVPLVDVPAFRGTARDALTYASALQAALSAGADVGTAGWIIDVRSNTGGNMLPMLAGLGPLLGEGELGAFRFPEGTRVPWTYRGGELWIGTNNVFTSPGVADSEALSRSPVAIIQGPRTASSGEAVALAFQGRRGATSFGRATAGLTTCNDDFELPDGASMAITVAWFEDRTGHVQRGPLQPDTLVTGSSSSLTTAAVEWLTREFTDT